MKLAYDIARCASGKAYPLAKTCARWLDEGHQTYQTFSAFPPSADCEHYIERKQDA